MIRQIRLLVFLIVAAGFSAGAQELTVKSMYQTMEILAGERLRTDANGANCALVKVQIPVAGAAFEGNIVGNVNFSVNEYLVYLTPGSRHLNVKCPGYKPYLVDFSLFGIGGVEPKSVYVLDVSMPVLSTITPNDRQDNVVLLKVSPRNNTTVKIDGEWCMINDEGMVTKLLPGGSHRYEIESPGYETARGDFQIMGDRKTELQINLVSLMATLNISSSTPGCEIYVNGTRQGSGTWSGQLLAGRYLVEGRKKGYTPWETTVELGDKMVKDVAIPPLAARYGRINLLSNPVGATLYLDGKEVGTSPSVIRDVIPGTYKGRLTASGYQELTFTVEVMEDGEIVVDKNLVKGDTQALLVTSSSNYSNSLCYDAATSELRYKNYVYKMVPVSGGTFSMGATAEQGEDVWDDEMPVHKVSLSDFSIGQTEVPQWLWEAVMGNNPSYSKGVNLPVEQVSWDDCQEFLKKLNSMTGQRFKLPTEAQWEYAARGGSRSKGYKYSGSNRLEDVAWFTSNSGSKTHEVATKLPNELGLYDMSGNVLEWCQDWKGTYSTLPETNPTGPSSGSLRVYRGGGWSGRAWLCRVSLRDRSTPDYRGGYLGFRLVH